jgi:SAM-dependent methyltransferase
LSCAPDGYLDVAGIAAGSDVAFLGAEAELIGPVLSHIGDTDVFVFDDSVPRLEELQHTFADPRLWFLIGDAEVMPLPNESVDAMVFGAHAGDVNVPEALRVLRRGGHYAHVVGDEWIGGGKP